jgi:hypothetical protein
MGTMNPEFADSDRSAPTVAADALLREEPDDEEEDEEDDEEDDDEEDDDSDDGKEDEGYSE